jgi:hypothetical protein
MNLREERWCLWPSAERTFLSVFRRTIISKEKHNMNTIKVMQLGAAAAIAVCGALTVHPARACNFQSTCPSGWGPTTWNAGQFNWGSGCQYVTPTNSYGCSGTNSGNGNAELDLVLTQTSSYSDECGFACAGNDPGTVWCCVINNQEGTTASRSDGFCNGAQWWNSSVKVCPR